MRYAVITLPLSTVAYGHCENCGLSHPFEETNCVASKDHQAALTANPYDAGTHCVHWWDGEACCWCGDDPCTAAACALG